MYFDILNVYLSLPSLWSNPRFALNLTCLTNSIEFSYFVTFSKILGNRFFVVCPFAVLILSSFAFCNVLLLLLFPITYLGNISNKNYHFLCGFPKEWNSMTIVQKFTKRKKALGPWLMYLVFWLVCLASLNCDDICYIWYFGSICLGICCKTFYVKKL